MSSEDNFYETKIKLFWYIVKKYVYKSQGEASNLFLPTNIQLVNKIFILLTKYLAS